MNQVGRIDRLWIAFAVCLELLHGKTKWVSISACLWLTKPKSTNADISRLNCGLVGAWWVRPKGDKTPTIKNLKTLIPFWQERGKRKQKMTTNADNATLTGGQTRAFRHVFQNVLQEEWAGGLCVSTNPTAGRGPPDDPKSTNHTLCWST